jgi:hypothetical protein
MVDRNAEYDDWMASATVGKIETSDNYGEHPSEVGVHKSPKGVVYLSILSGPEMLAVILDSAQAAALADMLFKAFNE